MTDSHPAAPRSRVLVAVTALFALLAVLAGCGLPTDAQVSRGLPVADSERQGPLPIPQPPPDDAEPQQLFQAFLNENSSFQSNPEAVEAYLTGDAAQTWSDRSGALIYDRATLSLESTSDNRGGVTMTVTAEIEGEVDAEGRLVEFPPGTTEQASFSMRQDRGEWRVSGLPEDFNVWLTRPLFDREFSEIPLYYGAPGRDVLVPDVRWFPSSERMAVSVAQALVQPAPLYLRGAVTTGVPAETEVGSVTVDNGVAQVDLAGATLGRDLESRRLLWAQMVATLTQIQAIDVTGVLLVSGARELGLADVETPVSSAGEVGVADADEEVPGALLRLGTDLQWIDPYDAALANRGRPEGMTEDLPQIGTGWVDVAADDTADRFVAVNAARDAARIWLAGEPNEVPTLGTGLTAPGFDDDGRAWLAGQRGGSNQVWALAPQAGDVPGEEASVTVAEVDTPWLADSGEIRALRIAPDSQRALVVIHDTTTGLDSVGVVGIVREAGGNPTSLTAPLPVAPGLGDIASATWVDETRIGLLARPRGDDTIEGPQPYVATVGGWTLAQGDLERAETIIGIPGGRAESPFIVLNSSGFAFVTEPVQSFRNVRGTTDIIIPGA